MQKLHFKCSDFNSSIHATVHAEYIYVFSSKCDEFPMPQIDRKSKQVNEQNMKIFICNQYGEKLAMLNADNVKISG